MISGIIHVVNSGGPVSRWRQPVALPAEVLIDSTHMKAHRSAEEEKGGPCQQAIGIRRGGRNSKLHALTDGEGRPLRFLLTGGNRWIAAQPTRCCRSFSTAEN